MTLELNILPLLQKTKALLDRQRNDLIKSGESFNMFSVLGMERLENRTHSAFIAALLNPEGSHLQKNIFLRLFLHQLNDQLKNQYDGLFKISEIDLPSAKVTTEFYIHEINKQKKTGGRIDILIQDKNGYTISIENKIDAPDQDAQIQRYYNFNKDKNLVIYLTLHGSIPDKKSRGELVPNEDFVCISYRKEILEWLRRCLNLVDSSISLQNSIRQYMLLVKKITNTMKKKEEQEFFSLILDHYDESKAIYSHFDRAHHIIGERLRKNYIKKLELELGEDWRVRKGSKIDTRFAQVWIRKKDSPLVFGVESFNGNGHKNGQMFMGIFKTKNFNLSIPNYRQPTGAPSMWLYLTQFSDYKGKVIQISNAETLKELHRDKDFFEGLVNHMIQETSAYIKTYDREIMELNSKIAS